MSSARRRAFAAIALTTATLAATACGGGGSSGNGHTNAAAANMPRHIVGTPKDVRSATEPQANGVIWTLAGERSRGIYAIDATSGHVRHSMSVSAGATSIAETAHGVLGLALGTTTSGALELINAKTYKPIETVPLPAPARYVTVASNGSIFYVLSGWSRSASVTLIGARTDTTEKTIPVPADTVSVAPDPAGKSVYVLERNGLVSEISLSGRLDGSRFKVGSGSGSEKGLGLAISPDDKSLYVLKGTPAIANIAVVDLATQSVTRVLPAPSHCVAILAANSGRKLYEVAGTASYGNIQIYAV
jgi:DNA-binding beta-propeller fold protein YncE